ncbi:DUF559 domain-containing protein [Bifidobacterium sp. 82T10]|uniref:DUF559 domain-containing protein n=1 Tax=Bifidobacterium miconis TaxID=2834435 RepID=A0ABS6WE42_9BIFI|nr:DUF559 domain-containing protein [Bifidobacterium miconis]
MEQREKDAIRTRDLEAASLLVVRFANDQVDRMFHEVCMELDRVVAARIAMR